MPKKILLQNPRIIKAFNRVRNFYLIGPYTTTNHCVMPIYVDIRAVYSDPKSMKVITRELVKFIKKSKIKFNFILGGATAGIPIATTVGYALGVPTGYVRKAPKGGGTNRTVEGSFKKGAKALLIDDAMGQGAGKLDFLNNIRRSGFKIDTLMVVSSRGYQNPEYFKWFAPAKVNFISFCDLTGLIKNAVKDKIITPEAGQLLSYYNQDAAGWNQDKKKWQEFLNYKKQKRHESVSGV